MDSNKVEAASLRNDDPALPHSELFRSAQRFGGWTRALLRPAEVVSSLRSVIPCGIIDEGQIE